MATFGATGSVLNPDAMFPYQMLFRGSDPDAEYLAFLAQLAKLTRKHAPAFIRKVGEVISSPIQTAFNAVADLWEWMLPAAEPTSFLGKLWSWVCTGAQWVKTFCTSHPWLIVAIIVLIVVVWMLYRARQARARRTRERHEAPDAPVVD